MSKHLSNQQLQNIFVSFLASKKLRLTLPRKIIFNELISRDSHIDIDDLFTAVKAKDSNIGLATLYRTIKLLAESGLIRKVNTGTEKTSYEAIIGRSHHDHLTCDICGENIEFVDHEMEELQEKIAQKYGYKLTGHALYLQGICAKCSNSKE